MKKVFGVFFFTLGVCTAFACGCGVLCYAMNAAILKTAFCIFGTATGAAITCVGSNLIDF